MELLNTVKSYIRRDPQKAAITGVASVFGLYVLSKAFSTSAKSPEKIKDVSEGYRFVLSKPLLTDEEVTHRGKFISQISISTMVIQNYENKTKGQNYEGRVKIEFYLKEVTDGLFVDFYGDAVKKLLVNKKDSTLRENFSKRRLNLPWQNLNKGINVIEVFYENSYSNVENALHSFIDTERSQFIFSRSGPVYAHKIFPCFDQPDLRANISLRVLAPKIWKVYSNEILKKVSLPSENYLNQCSFQAVQEDSQLFEFNTTQLLATYQFSIVAGPFEEIIFDEQNSNVKFSLIFRPGIKKNVQEYSKLFFEIFTQTLSFMKANFDLQYPFSKFEVVFYSGIGFPLQETPGIAGISDDLLSLDGELNELEIFDLSLNLVNHVIKSWFGGLITNKWWDDIWIQEGISTYLSYFIFDSCEELKKNFLNPWLLFLFEKEKAYALDQNLNSHPVCFHISSTAQCKNQLDPLTILKSASAIRYLVKNIGFDNFKICIKKLVEDYKFGSIDGNSFIELCQNVLAKGEKNDFDLHSWYDSWLKAPGVNQLEALMELEEGQLICLNIVQTSAVKTSNHLRDYTNLKAAFYYPNGAEDFYPMDILAESVTNIDFQKLEKPSAILLNYDDEDYVKIKLDKSSYQYFKKNGIKNLVVRASIWRGFSDHVKDGKISPLEFIEIVTNEIGNEVDPLIVNFILSNAKQITYNYLPSDYYSEVFQQLFQSIMKCLKRDSQSFELIHTYLDYLPSFAESDMLAMDLYTLLIENKVKLRKRHHIKILRALFSKGFLSVEEKKKLLEKLNDGSIRISQEEKRLRALELTDFKDREKIFKKLIKPPAEWPLRTSQAVMKGFNHLFNRKKNIEFIEKYFDYISEVFDETSVSYWKSFTTILFPFWCENHEYVIEKLKKIQKLHRNKGSAFLDVLANLQEQASRRRTLKLRCLDQQRNGLQKSWITIKSSQRVGTFVDNLDLSQSQDFTIKLLDTNPKNDLIVGGGGGHHRRVHSEFDEQNSFLSSDRASGEDEEEAKAFLNKSWKKPSPFDKSASVFRERSGLTKNLRAMWQADVSHFTFQKVISSTETKPFYENLYEKHYLKLSLLFLQKQLESKKWPEVSVDEFNAMCKNAKKVYGPGLTQTNIDSLFIQLSKESPKSSVTQSKDRSLCRFEFIELLLRLAFKKYSGNKEITTPMGYVDKFFETDLYPNVKTAEYSYEGFRYEKIQNEQVDQILRNYEKTIRDIYGKFKQGKDNLTLKDVLAFLNEYKIQMEEEEVKQCFTLSKVMPIDELATGTKSFDTMDIAEFFEFIVRVSEFLDENDLPTYQKTENLLKTITSSE